MKQETSLKNILTWVLIVLGVGISYWAYQTFDPSAKSDSQKYDECVRNAGTLYDDERQTITKNASGYSAAEQQQYYTNSSDGYTSNLQGCKDEYQS